MARLPKGFTATKIAPRTFEGGMDQDTDPKLVPKNRFKDSEGMTLKRSGEHYALSIDQGPLHKANLDDDTTLANVHTLGTVRAVYRINGVDEECVTVFTYNSNDAEMTVSCYRPSTGVVYSMYVDSVTIPEGERNIGAVVYRENDFDYIYFTNYVDEVKKMKCTITTAGHAAYTDDEIYLFRRGIRGKVTSAVPSYTGTGYIACGTYQFYFRGVDNVNNRYTRWSAPSALVRVGMDHDADEKSYGGLGHITNGLITLTLNLYSAYSTLYTHYQVAVVENVKGLESGTQEAKILKPELISDFTGDPGSASFIYNSNTRAKEIVPIGELTTDDLPIEAVRGLGIKNNRMLLGKVKLADLDYDQTDPIVANTTTTIVESKAVGTHRDPYADPQVATEDVGYFRDEVYRYYVSYFDENGNYSRPKTLDFSSATQNKATAGCIDWKFPSRKNKKYGTLIDSSDNLQILKLRLMGLDNHPTWAKGFVILRAKRKKKIQFQTPMVPSILVQPARAVGNYPDQRSDKDSVNLDVLNVDIPNPQGTFVPKNFFHVVPKSLIRFGDFYDKFDDTVGGVYTSNLTSDYPPYYLRLNELGDYPLFDSDDENFQASSDSNTERVSVWKTGGEPATKIVSGDTKTIKIYSRTIGASSWGTADTTYVSYASPDVSAGDVLNLTVNDYLITIEDD